LKLGSAKILQWVSWPFYNEPSKAKIEKAVLSTKAFFKTKGLFSAALARPEKKGESFL